jgi:TRAP-type mannitol/chloroaromatic compound transport system permease small subunit
VVLGSIFSDRVQVLAELLGNLTWVIVGVIAAIILGWKLLQYVRNSSEIQTENPESPVE